MESKEALPVIQVFKDKTRRELIAYSLRELDTDSWTKTGAFRENTSVGRESIRQKIGVLVAYGVLEVKNPDVNIPHYRLADTQVIDAIREWDGYPLSELFAFKGRQSLVQFYLTKADPEQSYSMNGIARESSVKNATVSDHIDVLVDAGLVDAVEGTRSTEYQLDVGSSLYQYLHELNEVLYETYQQRASER